MFFSSCSLRRWDSSLAPGLPVPEWHWCTPESERVHGEWCLDSEPLPFDIVIVPFKNIPQENNVPIPDNLVPPHIADIPLPLLLLPPSPVEEEEEGGGGSGGEDGGGGGGRGGGGRPR